MGGEGGGTSHCCHPATTVLTLLVLFRNALRVLSFRTQGLHYSVATGALLNKSRQIISQLFLCSVRPFFFLHFSSLFFHCFFLILFISSSLCLHIKLFCFLVFSPFSPYSFFHSFPLITISFLFCFSLSYSLSFVRFPSHYLILSPFPLIPLSECLYPTYLRTYAYSMLVRVCCRICINFGSC